VPLFLKRQCDRALSPTAEASTISGMKYVEVSTPLPAANAMTPTWVRPIILAPSNFQGRRGDRW
jgi:hypothetical protein